MSPKIKIKTKGKSKLSHSRPNSHPIKPRILSRTHPPELSARDKALQQLHLKSSDILSEASRDGYLIFVTKNGMKIRAKL